MNLLKLSPAGLSNYITSLTNKGFLIKKGDMTTIFEILMPEKEQQLYIFKLQKINEDVNSTT